jgi:signal transduction histidine kinase
MWDIARLNVLLELFSECAGVGDLETLLHVAAGRLHWVLDFDHCAFIVLAGDRRRCWTGTRADESLRAAEFEGLSDAQRALIERVLDTGAPAHLVSGMMCVPLQIAGKTLGALSFSTASGPYTLRDLRLGHHAGQHLGALISRLALEAEATQLSHRKDELLALLGHELRNPLAPIVSAVELLRMRSNGQPTPELDIIARQAQHMVRLVDDLLDVARLTRGTVILERAPVELGTVVARAVEMVGPLVEQRRHTL